MGPERLKLLTVFLVLALILPNANAAWWNSTFLLRAQINPGCPGIGCNNSNAWPFFFDNATIMNNMGPTGISIRYITECGAGNFSQQGIFIKKWNEGKNFSAYLKYNNDPTCLHYLYYNNSAATNISYNPKTVFDYGEDLDSNSSYSLVPDWNQYCSASGCGPTYPGYPWESLNGWEQFQTGKTMKYFTPQYNSSNYTDYCAYWEFRIPSGTGDGAISIYSNLSSFNLGYGYIWCRQARAGSCLANSLSYRTTATTTGAAALTTNTNQNYLVRFCINSSMMNFTRQQVSNEELAGNNWDYIHQYNGATPITSTFTIFAAGNIANQNTSSYFFGFSYGVNVPYLVSIAPQEDKDSYAASAVSLCDGATCAAITTIKKASPLNFNASGTCRAPINPITGYFNFILNGTMLFNYSSYNWVNNTQGYINTSVQNLFNKSDTLSAGLICGVGATNSTEAYSTAYTINNTAPVIGKPWITSNETQNFTFYNNSILTCNFGNYSDADNDANGSAAYQWYLNGTVISGQTNNTLNLFWITSGVFDLYNCSVKQYDSGYSYEYSAEKYSDQVSVLNLSRLYVTNCSVGYPVLNFTVRDEQTFALINSTMEASFILYDNVTGEQTTATTLYLTNSTNFTYCIYPFAYIVQVSSYQTYYPASGSGYDQRNYYLVNTTLNVSNIQQIYLYLLNSSVSTAYTFQVVNQYLVPISNVTLSVYRFETSVNAWVIIEQQSTDFSGYALFNLQQGTLYRMVASASGYTTLNVDFTPGAVTSIQIRMDTSGAIISPLPDFENVFNDVSYKLIPTDYYHNASTLVEYQISSASSSLQNYSMVITFKNSSTSAVVFNTTVTTSPGGGILNYTATQPGQYFVQITFKHSGYATYSPVPFKFVIGGVTGAAQAKDLFATGFINGWAYYFIAVVFAMVAAGFALRFSPETSAVAGLLVLWGFTAMYPAGVVATVGAVGITTLYATVLTSIMVAAALFAKWFI